MPLPQPLSLPLPQPLPLTCVSPLPCPCSYIMPATLYLSVTLSLHRPKRTPIVVARDTSQSERLALRLVAELNMFCRKHAEMNQSHQTCLIYIRICRTLHLQSRCAECNEACSEGHHVNTSPRCTGSKLITFTSTEPPRRMQNGMQRASSSR